MNIKNASAKVLSLYPYEGMTIHMKRYAETTQLINSKIPAESKIADLGAGVGILSALLSCLGHTVLSVDDLNNPCYESSCKQKLRSFLLKCNVDFVPTSLYTFKSESKFNVVILNDVVEHLDNPRTALNNAIDLLETGGVLILGLPNSAALFKRLKSLFGKTIYPSLNEFYFNVGKYTGHIREYTSSEVYQLLKNAGLINITVKCRNLYSWEKTREASDLTKIAYGLYSLISDIKATFRDSIFVFGIKPEFWQPVNDDNEYVQTQFKKIYRVKN